MVGVGRVGETFGWRRRGRRVEVAGDLSGCDAEGDEPGEGGRGFG